MVDAADAENVTVAEFVRRAVAERLNPRVVSIDASEFGLVPTNYLSRVPAGPAKESVNTEGDFLLSQHVADALQAKEGDYTIMVEGESMEAAGIYDGSLLIVRPLEGHLKPRKGEVVLVQLVSESGNYESTVKFWQGGNPPEIQDAEGNKVKIPEGVRLEPFGIVKGIIARV